MFIPYDKQLHFLAGIVISALVAMAAQSLGYNPWFGFLIAAFVGMLKEAYDRTGKGQKDFIDFWWTGFGGVIPSFFMEVLL